MLVLLEKDDNEMQLSLGRRCHTAGVYMEHIRSSFTVICISTVMWFHTQLSYNLSRKIACARDFSWLGQYCDITAGC